jgi:YidC/Oxa1 family membrane protein insertase
VNLRRLGVVLIVFAVGLLVLTLYTQSRQAQRRDEQAKKQATRPAETPPPATKPAPPATTRPAATQPAATRPAATQPAAPPATATRPAAPTTTPDEAALEGWFDYGLPAAYAYPVVLGSADPRSGYLLEVELASRGAAVKTVKLSKYFVTVADKRLWEEDPDGYDAARRQDPEKYKGHYVLLEGVGAEREHLPLATHMLKLNAPGIKKQVPFNLSGALYWRPLPDSTAETAAFEIQYGRDINFGRHGAPRKPVPYFRLVKRYRIAKNDYAIEVSLTVENLLKRERLEALVDGEGGRLLTAAEVSRLVEQGEGMEISLEQYGPGGVPQEDRVRDTRRAAVGRYSKESDRVDLDLKPINDRLGGEGVERVEVGASNDAQQPVVWIGCTNKYFGSMMYLRPRTDESLNAEGYGAAFFFDGAEGAAKRGMYVSGLSFPNRRLAVDEPLAFKLQVYAGPKKRSIFHGGGVLPYREIYERLAYLDTIETGACCSVCSFEWLTWGMKWLLDQFSMVAFGNYGLAIILLVVMVRLALHPLTKKGQVSMMKMQKLGPQMQKIKEKYKDDKEAMNREMMAMYKQAGATPLLGCLPMLLQMPIWIALFTSLRISVDLRHAAFLPVWLTDLSVPDAVIPFGRGVEIPILSWVFGLGGGSGVIYGINLLPILLTVAMVLNMKLTPQAAAPAGDQGKQTNKMMMYLMPAMMFFFFYQAPCGLNLYIMTSTFAGVAEQKIIRRHIKAREEVQAASEATIAAPGKRARGHRPKKPRGPFWTKGG